MSDSRCDTCQHPFLAGSPRPERCPFCLAPVTASASPGDWWLQGAPVAAPLAPLPYTTEAVTAAPLVEAITPSPPTPPSQGGEGSNAPEPAPPPIELTPV